MKTTGFLLLLIPSVILASALHRELRHIRQGPPCPLEWNISPCTCRGPAGVPTIDCSAVSDEDDLVRIFQSAPLSMNMRGIDIHGSALRSIPGGAFENHTLHLFLLNDNFFESISPDAFKGSEGTIDLIRLSNNSLTSFPYDVLKSLTEIRALVLASNKINEIPANAFPESSLEMLDLSDNFISSIGASAFSRLENLVKLDLSDNKLTVFPAGVLPTNKLKILVLANNSLTEIEDSALNGINFEVLNLSNTKINVLKQSNYGSLLTTESSLEKIILTGNAMDCESSGMQWIKSLSNEVKAKLVGFKCSNGSSLSEWL